MDSMMKRLLGITVALLPGILFPSCASLPPPPPPPLGAGEVAAILAGFEDQERRVNTCFGDGRLSIETADGDEDVHVLVAAQKDPFRAKLEITHPWGSPVLHLYADDMVVEAVAFPLKRVYRGRPEDVLLPKWLPLPLAPGLIWTLARGFPMLARHARAESSRGDEIRLLDEDGRPIQIIAFHRKGPFPMEISLPETGAAIFFSALENRGGIQDARKVRLFHSGTGAALELALKERVFNQPVPPEVFEVQAPPHFERRRLLPGQAD